MDYSGYWSPKCPVENVSTMKRQPSVPARITWKCSQCGVVLQMPKAPLDRALAKYEPKP